MAAVREPQLTRLAQHLLPLMNGLQEPIIHSPLRPSSEFKDSELH